MITFTSIGINLIHEMLRPKTVKSTTAPTTKRQNEMFSGVNPCCSTSTLTTSAPVPQRMPAPQAATNAKPAEEDWEGDTDT